MSHFALRLAYCRTEELRRWFLLNECQLFKHRFNKLDAFAKAALEDHDMEYKPLTPEAFAEKRKGISETLNGIMKRDDAEKILSAGASGFYAVPFEEVADLVRGRRVFVSGGEAHVPRDQLTSLVVGAFRAALSKSLAVASRRWAQHVAGEERERLAPVIVSLSKRYLGRDFGKPGESGADGASAAVTLEDLPSAAKASFPLCAKNLFDAVKREHHLRHEGRRQLQLYMKGIGLSLEEAMLFWKTEFCKKIPAEKFEKEYGRKFQRLRQGGQARGLHAAHVHEVHLRQPRRGRAPRLPIQDVRRGVSDRRARRPADSREQGARHRAEGESRTTTLHHVPTNFEAVHGRPWTRACSTRTSTSTRAGRRSGSARRTRETRTPPRLGVARDPRPPRGRGRRGPPPGGARVGVRISRFFRARKSAIMSRVLLSRSSVQ